METSTEIHRVLKYNNFLTCLYLPAIVCALKFSDHLYSVGKKNIYLEYVLALAEILKYIRYYRVQKNHKRKFTIGNIFKSLLTCGTMILIFHVGAILFGAPLLSDQYETFFFAVLMTILTVLPVCLHLDSDNVYTLFSSLMHFEGSTIQEHFLMNIRFCMFGAWLGAVVIPLDWNRPYQDWPIPCCYGAIAGCCVGNIVALLQNVQHKSYDKGKGKFGL